MGRWEVGEMLKPNVCLVFPEWIPNSHVLKLPESSDISRLMIFSRQSWRCDFMILHLTVELKKLITVE